MRVSAPKMVKFLTSAKGLALLFGFVAYTMIVDTNLQQRRLMIADHYDLARSLISQDVACDIGNPHEDGDVAPDDATKTLLTSYPGSGQRFAWTIIKALTKMEVADDWNFGGKLEEGPLSVKTAYPLKSGVWSWGDSMDQVLLLVRNPRWAIPAYHNLVFELGYATDWASAYVKIPDLYTKRPAVVQWESWRDSHFNTEMNAWGDHIEFWMDGGYDKSKGKKDVHCVNSKINCRPKAVVDFEHLFQENPTSEYVKVTDILEASTNVELVAAQARVCVLDAVFENKSLHEGGRPHPELVPQYRFTMVQHDKMLNRTLALKAKYSQGPFEDDAASQELIKVLDAYISDMKGEHGIEAGIFLEDFVASYMGVTDCEGLSSEEGNTCKFMKKRFNHKFFFDEDYPVDFPYFDWLKDRATLAKLNYSNLPQQTWLSIEDHCDWDGVTCEDFKVTALDLKKLGLVGKIPAEMCNMDFTISADPMNCPPGCCE